jgi:hypothetical protein
MNNREIKFRLCHTDQVGNKTIHYKCDRTLIGLDGKIYENYGTDWKSPMWESVFDGDVFIQQYTGCKDKDGTEIYEGDIIEYKKNGSTEGYVSFIAGIFVVNWPDQIDEELGYLLINDITVVGNSFLKNK